jgi:LPS export ABC transporter protein LptC
MKLNRSFIKAVFAVAILGAALSGAYFILSRADMTLPPLLRPAAGSRLFMSMEGFRFSQSENGRVAWRVRARNADLYESKEAKLKDLEITFSTPDNKEAVLIGEQGVLDTVSGNGSVKSVDHEVRIVSSDGYLLTTNALFWKARERQVITPDPFKLLGSEIYLEGKGLSANVDMRTITVNSNVKAVLQE